jgi:hypothetical protein
MKIVGGPIERIDDPFPWGPFPLKRTFLRQEIVVWEGIGNDPGDGSVTECVDLCDRIDIAFILNLMGATQMKHLNPACLFGRSHGYFKKPFIRFHFTSYFLRFPLLFRYSSSPE